MYKSRVTTPWGVEVIETARDNLNYLKRKLNYDIEQQKVKNIDMSLKDVEAYNIILGYESEVVASHFFITKEMMKRQGNKYKGNMSVIERMKSKGLI